VVRNKAFRKVLRFYKITFGLKAPYKVRAHGCAVCVAVCFARRVPSVIARIAAVALCVVVNAGAGVLL
jgi:hypothetical protein